MNATSNNPPNGAATNLEPRISELPAPTSLSPRISGLAPAAPDHQSRVSDHAPFRRARRNGKIARLPKKLRQLINELLSDGLPYADIIIRLQESTDPPLPAGVTITEKNLSTWHTGGFQDWEKHQERMELISAKLDFALDLAQSSEPHKLQELSLQLAAVRICEFLSELAIADPGTDPLIYLRLLSALPRLAKESLNLQKYRDAVSSGGPALGRSGSDPQAPSSPATLSEEDQKEAMRTAFLDGMDDLMGLRSYRHLRPGSADLGPARQGPAVSHEEADLRPSGLQTPPTSTHPHQNATAALAAPVPATAAHPTPAPEPHAALTPIADLAVPTQQHRNTETQPPFPNPSIQESTNPSVTAVPETPPADTPGHSPTPDTTQNPQLGCSVPDASFQYSASPSPQLPHTETPNHINPRPGPAGTSDNNPIIRQSINPSIASEPPKHRNTETPSSATSPEIQESTNPPASPRSSGGPIANQNSKLENCLAEFCPECNRILPPLLPTGERPDHWCSHCGTPLPAPRSKK